MARMKKVKLIEALMNIEGLQFDENAEYNDLYALLKEQELIGNVPTEPAASIRIVSKIQKRNTFLANSVRDERDAVVLLAEIGKREHKGKIKRITTIKEMDVDESGFWITTFIIDLKE